MKKMKTIITKATFREREAIFNKQSFNNSPRKLQKIPMYSAKKHTTLCQKMSERKT